MNRFSGLLNRVRRAAHVAAATGLLFAASPHAATIVVNAVGDTIAPATCTLRAAVASINAGAPQGGCTNSGAAFGSGDLITFSPAVAVITLADAPNNQLAINVNNLVIQGPVAIERDTGSINPFRIIRHTGSGTLTLSSLSVRGGLLVTNGDLGAGVLSNGTVNLQNTTIEENVTNCALGCNGAGITAASVTASTSRIRNNQARGVNASGGGIFSTGLVELANSNVEGNRVLAGGCGGGIYVGGEATSQLRIISSYVGGNRAQDTNANGTGLGGNGGALCVADGTAEIINSEVRGNESLGEGGALYSFNTAIIDQSSFSGNFALRGGGAVRFGATLSGHQIRSSTFFNNSAGISTTNSGNGGALLVTNELAIRNSTFSFNRSAGVGGAILHNGGTLTLISTIVANSISENPANGANNVDIYRNSGTATIVGNNNLIRRVTNITVPADTLTGDPLLGVLGDYGCVAPAGNGGSAQGCPRALIPGAGSPAINAGANPLNLPFDQRGNGYPRVIGASADIGAIETGAASVGPWVVTVQVLPAGAGVVTCTPNPVPNGQSTSCTAVANAGFVFTGFAGDCSGATCSLSNVTAARNVTANFARSAAATTAAVPALPWVAVLVLALGLIGVARRVLVRR